MDFQEVLLQRRSITQYKDIPITRDQWMQIVEAGTHAPNVGNIQDWRFLVVLDKKLRNGIAEICHGQMWMSQAPLHIVCCADTQRSKQYYGVRGEMLYAIQDVAAAAENMLLQATALGLGSNWVGSFDEDGLKGLLGIPGYVRAQAVLTIGYANEVRPRPQKQPVDAFTFIDKWSNPVTATEKNVMDVKYAKARQQYVDGSKDVIASFVNRIRKWLNR